MKRIVKLFAIIVVLAFIVIQFFQPEKNVGEISENHIFKKEELPDDVKSVLQNACLDCHSNTTNYLWYHKIAPVSWMVNKHVVEGKDELNFSEWGTFDIFDKIAALEELCSETEREIMPIKAYVKMHKEAKLSKEQVAMLCDWTEKLSEQLLEEVE